jgi:hypothetical protein
MRPLKPLTFIFSPLFGAVVVGYILLKLNCFAAKWFALIIIAGLVLTLINGVIMVINMSKRNS